MIKKFLSVVLSSMFILMIVMPTVILVFDDTADVSIFFSTSEEEKDKNQEKNLDKEFVSLWTKNALKSSEEVFNQINIEYFFETYAKPDIELFSPPPKVVLFNFI